jgi:hypothetical protein
MPFEKGNPGRPRGARQKHGDAFIEAYMEEFRINGKAALTSLATLDPKAFLQIGASLCPKDAAIQISGDPDNPQVHEIRITRLT